MSKVTDGLKKAAIAAVAGVLLLLLIVVLAAPLVAKHYVEGWLIENGVENAAISDIDVNLFTGELEIETLNIAGGNDRTGALDVLLLDIELSALFARRFEISYLALRGGEFDLHSFEDNGFHIGALRLPPDPGDSESSSDDAGGEWSFALNELVVEDVVIKLIDPRHEALLDIEDLQVSRIDTLAPANNTTIDLDMALDGARIRVNGDVRPIADVPAADVRLRIDDVRLQTYDALLSSIESPQGTLTSDLQLAFTGAVEDQELMQVRAEGTLSLDDLSAGLGRESFAVDSGEWTGVTTLAWLAGQSAPSPSASGNPALRDVRVMRNRLDLVALDELELSEFALTGVGEVSGQNIGIDGLRLIDIAGEPAVVAVETVEVIDFGFNANDGLVVERIGIKGANIQVERGEDGQLRQLGENGLSSDDATEASAARDEGDSSLPVSIGSVTVDGDSRLRFSDLSVDPGFSLDAAISRVSLSNLAPDKTASFELGLEEQQGARLTASGTVEPVSQGGAIIINAALTGFELPRVSTYLPGYDIERGRLAVDAVANLSDGELALENAVMLDRLKLSAQSEDGPDLLGDAMDMPLDIALDLLRDGDDQIRLDIPVSGQLDDLDVGTGDILRLATQRAVQRAAVSYVTNSLQPLGTILFVSKVAGQASRPRFEPIAFAPGGSVIEGDAREYADRIAEILDKRPNLSITFCGVAVPADRMAFEAELALAAEGEPIDAATEVPDYGARLLALAESRRTALQSYLVDTHSIDPERLYRCRDTVEVEDGGEPRIEVSL